MVLVSSSEQCSGVYLPPPFDEKVISNSRLSKSHESCVVSLCKCRFTTTFPLVPDRQQLLEPRASTVSVKETAAEDCRDLWLDCGCGGLKYTWAPLAQVVERVSSHDRQVGGSNPGSHRCMLSLCPWARHLAHIAYV